MNTVDSVDTYIDQFEGEARTRLLLLRDIVQKTAPDAQESFAYGLVAYKRNGRPLVYFGGFAYHTGFYATPNGHEAFQDDFSRYKQGRGSVQFPLDEPLPVDLIKRVIAYRVAQTGE